MVGEWDSLLLGLLYLVGGLEHEFHFSIYWELTNSYFSEGLKPPTRYYLEF
jgi:hypothetical protein